MSKPLDLNVARADLIRARASRVKLTSQAAQVNDAMLAVDHEINKLEFDIQQELRRVTGG